MTDQANLDIQAEIEKLRAENDALRKERVNSNTLTIKASQKGAISIYGLGRFPLTLYPGQATAFFRDCKGGMADRVHQFILDNDADLSFKDDSRDDILEICRTALEM